jgi:hypothetical protein
MPDSDTGKSALPARLGPPAPRPSLARSEIRAVFVSQLLVERGRFSSQPGRRRGIAEGAIGAYADSSKAGVKRMPMGYRTSIVA